MTLRKRKAFQLKSTRAVDFRMLGLPNGECDLDSIRAAIETRRRVAVELAEVLAVPVAMESANDEVVPTVVAGYRLMDPRYRRGLYERVQLGYVSREQEFLYRSGSSDVEEIKSDGDFAKAVANPMNAFRQTMQRFSSRELSFEEEIEIDSTTAAENSIDSGALESARDIVRMIRESDTPSPTTAADTKNGGLVKRIQKAVGLLPTAS